MTISDWQWLCAWALVEQGKVPIDEACKHFKPKISLKTLNRIRVWKKIQDRTHPEKDKARRRKYYLANREKFRAINRRMHLKHRAKRLAKNKRYYDANRVRVLAYNRNYRMTHPEWTKEVKKLDRKRNRESARRRDRRMIEKLTDGVVRKYLKRLGIQQPTTEQIISCRKRIQLKRAARALRLMAASAELSSLSRTLTES